MDATNVEIANIVVCDGWKIGSVFGGGRCEMCVNFVYKCCERKKNLTYVFA